MENERTKRIQARRAMLNGCMFGLAECQDQADRDYFVSMTAKELFEHWQEHYSQPMGSLLRNEEHERIGFLLSDLVRWENSNFELQQIHCDDDDETIHQYLVVARPDCMVCRGEGGKTFNMVFDHNGDKVGDGDGIGVDDISLSLTFDETTEVADILGERF